MRCIICGRPAIWMGVFTPRYDGERVTRYGLCENHPPSNETAVKVERILERREKAPQN